MIPNSLHFCFIGGGNFSIINYLSIKSSIKLNNPIKSTIYIDQEPAGEWWQKIKPLLTVERINTPTSVFDCPLLHPAHQTDVIRLENLIKHGGIYLDVDVICRKPFTNLLNGVNVVMAKEVLQNKTVGLCNAVILAPPNSNFLKRWYQGFDPQKSLWRGFRSKGYDEYYSEMSVKYSYFLSSIYAEEIDILGSEAFFYPNYSQKELALFFETYDPSFENSYCHHLWSNAAYDKYLKQVTQESIDKQDTSFSRLAKQFLD